MRSIHAARHRGHTLAEDVQGILTGCLLGALAIVMFKAAGLVPGGTIGLALLLDARSGLELSTSLLVVNLPFYALAALGLGGGFTVRTLAAVGLTALLTHLLPSAIRVAVLSPAIAALIGGVLCGLAMIVLFRHEASLGGLNVVVAYLQRRFGWKPGWVLLTLDAPIVLAGGWTAGGWERLGASLLAVATINFVLGMNHLPGRYTARPPAGLPST